MKYLPEIVYLIVFSIVLIGCVVAMGVWFKSGRVIINPNYCLVGIAASAGFILTAIVSWRTK